MSLCTVLVKAQYTGSVSLGKWSNQVVIYDVDGRPFPIKYQDITGSPFFDETYKYANLVLADGKLLTSIKTRIDLCSKEVLIVTSNEMEASFNQGMVKEISFADTLTGEIVQYTFKTGFPRADKQDEYSFYRVLCSGRCSFIRSMSTVVAEKINDTSLRNERCFKLITADYLFVNHQMNILPKNKDAVLALLADKKAELTHYIKANKINCNRAGDITMLVNYYNSL